MSTQRAIQKQSQETQTMNTVAEMIGRDVYTTTGVRVGKIDDIRIEFEQESATGLALTDVNRNVFTEKYSLDHGQGIMLPYRWVQEVGDIVLVMDFVSLLSS